MAGLTAAAPSALRVSGEAMVEDTNTETVISQVMLTLQPAIDAAIAQALAGSSSSYSVSSQEAVGPLLFTGSVGNTEYSGVYGTTGEASYSQFNSGEAAVEKTEEELQQVSEYEAAMYNINNAAIGASVTSSSRCNSQYFQVSNPGGTTPPVVCGLNTGEHS